MRINTSIYSHIFYIVILLYLRSSQSISFSNTRLDRRADVTVCGPEIYCLPKLNDTWVMSTVGVVRWNSEYPTFVVQGAVDIRLYDVTDMRKPVLEQLNVTNGNGYMNLFLDPNLQPPIFAPVPNRPKNSTASRMYCFLVTVAGDDIVNKPNGPYFFIQDPPSSNSSLDSVSTTISVPSSTDVMATRTPDLPIPIDTSNNLSNSGQRSTGLTSGAIAGISVGCVSVFAAAGIALIYFRRRNSQGPTHPGTSKDEIRNDGPPPESGLEYRRPSSLRLTANDAQLIAETYRRLLRKPSWGTTNDVEVIHAETGSPPLSPTYSLTSAQQPPPSKPSSPSELDSRK
ncbi:hypothetical protein K493DRAFT_335288 [Basidiobolus meristosporus CBS 931.73]|uniref:Uncharacterized protein n=1 Tax=Basidiobolus meristosporus CBS 931.73 TaxID=1314790 RepID=A0A1Y1YRH7_9FUNG|nr:hypothetical protein K493DRAFT_335288 [Basidiobolus meristosporus CBS 931.73]|eukprot:ORY00638.1 hypothetical protein K493DRAFT_335288 [Basidiobolus meristosporus CBS 931.73]